MPQGAHVARFRRVRPAAKYNFCASVFLAFFIALGTVPFPVAADYLGAAEYVAPQSLHLLQTPAVTSHSVSANTGAVQQEVPIVLPPGRGKATPKLSLVYSSQAGSEINAYGYGWADSIPYIERLNKRGSDKLYSNYDFFSTLDGELLPTVAATTTSFAAKTENGAFNRYTFIDNTWLVTDKAGTTYKFGYASTTRMDNVASSTMVHRWMLQEVRDTNGNYATYEYYKDGNYIYPYKIKYSGFGGDPGLYEVEFFREARTDVSTSTYPAFEVVNRYRIDEIQVKVAGSWTRKYELAYSAGDNGRRSILASVTETGKDESAATVTLPTTTLTYQSSAGREGWGSIASTTDGPEFLRYDVDNGIQIVDINGDSVADLVQAASNYHPGSGAGWTIRVTKLGTTSGWATSTAYALPSDVDITSGNADRGTRLVDVNGDGLNDIVTARYNGGGAADSLAYSKAYLNTGSGWATSTAWQSPMGFIEDAVGPNHEYRAIPSDLNGDGLVDLISSGNGSTTRVYINNGSGWTREYSTWDTVPTGRLTEALNSQGEPQLIDVNGDRLPDIVQAVRICPVEGCGEPTKAVYLNNGRGWNASSTPWNIPFIFYQATEGTQNRATTRSDSGIRFDDLNGDGLVDVIQSRGEVSAWECSSCTVYMNNGAGWYEDTDWDPPAHFVDDVTGLAYPQRDGAHRLGDFNGDGLSEIIAQGGVYYPNTTGYKADLLSRVTRSTGARTTYTYKGSGQYLTDASEPSNKIPFSLTTLHKAETYDGNSATSTLTYDYSGGAFYFLDSYDKQLAGFGTSTETDTASSSVRSFFHQGNATTSPSEYQDSSGKIGKLFRQEVRDSSGNLFDLTLNRWDATSLSNGRWYVSPAQMVSYSYDGNGTHKDRAETYQYDTGYGNLLQKVEWGEVSGGTDGSFTDVGADSRTTSFAYTTATTATTTGTGNVSSSLSTLGSATFYPSLDGMLWRAQGSTGQSAWTTTRNAADVGSDPNSEVSPTGTVGTVRAMNDSGYGRIDLARVALLFDTSSLSGKTVESATLSLYAQGKGILNANSNTYLVVVSSNPASTTTLGTSDYAAFGTTTMSDQVSMDLALSQYHDFSISTSSLSAINTSGLTKLGIRSLYDLNDVVPTITSSGGGSNLIAFYMAEQTGTSEDPKLTVEYSTPVGDVAGGMSLLSQEIVYDHGGAKAKETRRFYDGLSFGSAQKGSLTKQDAWIAGSTYASEQMAYTQYGLVASSTDPRGNVTTNTYDAYNLFVATSTNPLSQQTQAYYDYTLSKPKQTIDPNGLVFETVYDGLDRPTSYKQPDLSSPGSLVNKKTVAYTDTVGSRSTLETNYLDGSVSALSYTYLDGLDRAVQTRKEAEADFAVRDFVYDTRGLLQKETLPYFSSGSAKTAATSAPALFTTYTHDALKRPVSIANAVGTTSIAHDDWVATTTDANGYNKQHASDAYKRLVRVIEYNAADPYTTTYRYDALGNLASTTDALGNVRSFTYDGRGKRLTAQDLHASADGTFGTWSYVYDLAGNVASTTDPKSQQVDYAYDALNRVLSEDYTGAGGTEVEYGYDTCTYGVTRLCAATSTDAVSRFTYNALGLPATEQRVIGGTAYATAYSYNRQGGLADIVYPDLSEVRYAYNAAGLPETVEQKENGGSFSYIVSDFDYSPLEKVTFKEFGNGATTTITYDPAKLYRLTNIFTSAVATSSVEGGGGGFAYAGDWWGTYAQADQAPLALFNFLALVKTAFAEEAAPEPAEAALPEEPVSAAEDVGAGQETEAVEMKALPGEAHSDAPATATSTPTLTEEPAETEEVGPAEEPATAISTPSLTGEPEAATDTASNAVLIEDAPDEAATSTAAIAEEEEPASTLSSMLADLSPEEQATLKGQEIARLAQGRIAERVAREGHAFEIQAAEAIEGGLQVFIRAWDASGQQIGFGEDGSVDMERFRIFNPPILVPDEQGTYVSTSTNDITGEVRTYRYREDASEALLQVLDHTLAVMARKHGSERIVPEKRGNTTSIFYTASGANSPVDGVTGNHDSPSGNNYSNVRNASSGNGSGPADTVQDLRQYTNGSFYQIMRHIYTWNTSALGSDTVSSATISLYSDGASNPDGDSVSIVAATPGSTSDIVNADYDQLGTTKFATDISFSNWDNEYENFALNASGLANIAQSGISKFGVRTARDLSASAPTGNNSAAIHFADFTGTTRDPKLTIEHTAAATSTGTTTVAFRGIQNLTYAYDAVGNVTYLVDASTTTTAHAAEFGYDSLNRLIDAVTTFASSTPYSEEYEYNALGNLTSKDGIAYLYQGDTGSLYANPHAPTSIGGLRAFYDPSGNLTNHASTTNDWDYRNRLIAAHASSSPSTLYAYDHTEQRVTKWDGTATTTYANKYFSIASTTLAATTTKYVFSPSGELLGAIATRGATSTHTYIHPDHLGSTNVTTNQNGEVVQLLSYYPYGAERVSQNAGSSERHYIGERYDSSSDLNYFNNRYYQSDRALFLSQDSVLWSLGLGTDGMQLLSDPQLINSYGYGRDNPLTNADPSGLLSAKFSDFANAQPQFSQTQIQSLGHQSLPYFYRQEGDASGSLRINSQRIQDLGNLALGVALLLEGGRASGKAPSLSGSSAQSRTTLYHYTNDKGLDAILNTNQINPSLRANNPKDAFYGDGQYFTDIIPGTKTGSQISRALVGNPFQGAKFPNYVEVDASGMNLVKGREGIYLNPSGKPLDVSGLIRRSGKN